MTSPVSHRWDDDPVPLDVTTGEEAGARVVRVAGELDLHGAARVVSEACAMAAPGVALRVDLLGLTFIDSTGAGALLRIDREARTRGASQVRIVVARGGPAAGILALTGLADHVDLELGPDPPQPL